MYPAYIQYEYKDHRGSICMMAGVFASEESWNWFVKGERTYKNAAITIHSRKVLTKEQYKKTLSHVRSN